MNSRWRIAALVPLVFLPILAASADRERGDEDSTQAGITELRAALEKMEQTHQRKMAELQARIEKLEKKKKKAEKQSELEKLLEEAEKAAAGERKTTDETETKVFTGGQRQQQSLNPNISVTGDFIGALDGSLSARWSFTSYPIWIHTPARSSSLVSRVSPHSGSEKRTWNGSTSPAWESSWASTGHSSAF